MDKILVTGVTGMIGSYVLQNLIQKGINTLAGVRNSKKLDKNLLRNSDVVYLDYTKTDSIEKAISLANKVFLIPPMHPDMSGMMKNVISRMKNIKTIVCISASGADANSTFPLLRWHGEIKEAIISSEIPYTLIAPAHFYQNYVEFCSESIKKENTFYFPQGNTKKSMIDTYDIGEIAAKLLVEDKPAGNTYNLAGYDYDNLEIASMFTNILGKEVKYRDIEPEEYKKMLIKNQVPDWKIEIFLKLNAAWKAGSRLKSNEEAKTLLGREPRSFEKFIQENKESFTQSLLD